MELKIPAGNLQFILTDPLDQLIGHEVGYGLSLDHRNPSTVMMFPLRRITVLMTLIRFNYL